MSITRFVPTAAAAILSFVATTPLLFGQSPFGEEENLYVPPALVVAEQWSDAKPTLGIYESSYPMENPLLPIVFFDHPGDWTIPSRYHMFAGPIQTRDYIDTGAVWGWGSTYPKYYELLDVIGYRMSLFTTTTVTLRPGYSLEPGETPEVATTRAEVIRDYLTNIWKIEKSRLSIAAPELLSDTADILPAHEEARRVMIETASWDLIRPVRYAVKSRSVNSLMLRFLITPNLSADQVESIEVVMLSDDEVVGRASVPGHMDSIRYELSGSWYYGSYDPQVTLEDLSIEVLVKTYSGLFRRSNKVVLSRDVSSYDAGAYGDERVNILLPFFDYRDSTLNDYHVRMLKDLVDSLARSGRLLVQATGGGEYTEDYQVDPLTIDADHRIRLAETSRPADHYYDETTPGELYIYSPADYGDEYYGGEEPYYEEEYPEYVDQIGYDTAMAEGEYEEETAAPFSADSLALARAGAVVDYIRDTLKIEIANQTWEDTWMRPRSSQGYFSSLLLPEERWYARQVQLTLYGEDGIQRHEEWRRMQQEEMERARDTEASDVIDEAASDVARRLERRGER